MKSEAGLYFGIAKANCHLWLARLARPACSVPASFWRKFLIEILLTAKVRSRKKNECRA